jgi:hypothetical protein
VDVSAIALEWSARHPPGAITGAEPASAATRPPRAGGRRYATYAEAVADLDRPGLFEDRACYRLLDVSWAESPRLAFGPGRYFDVMNVCEAIGHELAGRAGAPVTMAGLPLRSLVGDPLDLARRVVVPAICVLTLRRDRAAGSSTFVLHWRDPRRVASGGGLFQVIPVGIFQPAGESPADAARDLDLWRSMTRELSEELRDEPERRGAIDYDAWPFHRALEAARSEGRARAHCLGLGVDPLTLGMDLMVALVMDAEVFDELFGELGEANDEGRILTSLGAERSAPGIAFTRETVDELTTSRPMQAAGAAILRLAWHHREKLL